MAFPNKAQQSDIRQSLPPLTGIYPTMNMMLTGNFQPIKLIQVTGKIRFLLYLYDSQDIQHVRLDRDHPIQILTKILERPDKNSDWIEMNRR